MNVLPIRIQVAAIASLIEGASPRATARLLGIHLNTVQSLAARVGEGCARLHDQRARSLYLHSPQIDEMWSFVGKKQKRITANDPGEFGDAWVFIALDVPSRMIVSYRVGKRTGAEARAFLADIRARIIGKPQIISDGFQSYVDAVEQSFGSDARYAMLVKQYDDADRYKGAERVNVYGAVVGDEISTPYVERQNLTVRMSCRRFARRTNAYSKRIDRMEAAVSLHVCFYNFVRVHESLRVTPMMQAGQESRVWSLEELILTAESLRQTPPDNDTTPPSAPLPMKQKPALRLIQGGRA